MIDRAKLEEALERSTEDWVPSSAAKIIIESARAHLDTLPRTKEIEVRLWVKLDENGKVTHCGPIGSVQV